MLVTTHHPNYDDLVCGGFTTFWARVFRFLDRLRNDAAVAHLVAVIRFVVGLLDEARAADPQILALWLLCETAA